MVQVAPRWRCLMWSQWLLTLSFIVFIPLPVTVTKCSSDEMLRSRCTWFLRIVVTGSQTVVLPSTSFTRNSTWADLLLSILFEWTSTGSLVPWVNESTVVLALVDFRTSIDLRPLPASWVLTVMLVLVLFVRTQLGGVLSAATVIWPTMASPVRSVCGLALNVFSRAPVATLIFISRPGEGMSPVQNDTPFGSRFRANSAPLLP